MFYRFQCKLLYAPANVLTVVGGEPDKRPLIGRPKSEVQPSDSDPIDNHPFGTAPSVRRESTPKKYPSYVGCTVPVSDRESVTADLRSIRRDGVPFQRPSMLVYEVIFFGIGFVDSLSIGRTRCSDPTFFEQVSLG